MRRLWRSAGQALAAGLLVTLAACGADEAVVALGEKDAVSVAAGETLVVDLGPHNSSIGDGWFLVGPPDPAVLTDGGEHYDAECDQPGCGGDLTWHFGTVAAGTTSITLRYCYRSRPPTCDPPCPTAARPSR